MRHIIDYREATGWTLMHPMACRPNLFNCAYNRALSEFGVKLPTIDGYYNANLSVTGKVTLENSPLSELPKDEVTQIRELLVTQGAHGTWNYSPYMRGLYNGLELALSVLESRAPVYRLEPTKYLVDQDTQDAVPLVRNSGGAK